MPQSDRDTQTGYGTGIFDPKQFQEVQDKLAKAEGRIQAALEVQQRDLLSQSLTAVNECQTWMKTVEQAIQHEREQHYVGSGSGSSSGSGSRS